MHTKESRPRLPFYLPFGIAVLTILIYLPVLDYPFINYDDNLYVTDNARSQQGLTWDNLRWAFTTGYPSNWHPLTWLSHLTDVTLFGFDSGWHHAVNVLIHSASSVLLFLVLKRMTGRLWCSAVVAALFAWHPLHVESVAWIAERKDVLCGFFWMLTLLAYGRFAERVSVSRYLVVCLVLALALMAKAMAVTLPCVLLLLDFWPLGRMKLFEPGRLRCVALLVAEKIPLFALSIGASVATYLTQQAGGAMNLGETLSGSERIGNALTGYGFYLSKTFWPSNLAVFYPHPRDGISWGVAFTVLAVIGVVTIAVLLMLRSRPYGAVGWCWFLGTLVPVIGLVQVGGQAYACRYAYLPQIGLFVALVWGAADLLRDRRRTAAVAGAAVVMLCLWRSHVELGYWQSSYALFSRSLAITGSNSMAETALGNALLNMGRSDEALAPLDRAIAMTPHYMEAYINKGKALSFLGRRKDERAVYEAALAMEPANAKLHNNLGASYARDHFWPEAEGHLREAIRLDDKYIGAQANLAMALLDQGKWEEASQWFEKVLAYQPERDDLWVALARARWRGGDRKGTGIALDRALSLAPESPEASAFLAEFEAAPESP